MPEENASLGRGIGNMGRLAYADRTIRWQASEPISPGSGREFSSGNAHAGNPHADQESDGGHGADGASTGSESWDRRTNATERNGECSGTEKEKRATKKWCTSPGDRRTPKPILTIIP
jgi:hypothetical protein